MRKNIGEWEKIQAMKNKEPGFKLVYMDYDGIETKMRIPPDATLSEMREHFDMFLRGCGFYWEEEKEDGIEEQRGEKES